MLPSARCTNAVDAAFSLLSNCGGIGTFGVPVKVGESIGAFFATSFMAVVAKLGSFPIAFASSFNVLSASGDWSTRSANF
ncbi:hypothetical protein WT81_18770 [Burkholderia stagnalis]|nr:hypothetical protein WT80_05960 [Burkholderia stagnalis]KWK58077.1 hypothetical protein WT81_18770 [Burkholderia stagnalis]